MEFHAERRGDRLNGTPLPNARGDRRHHETTAARFTFGAISLSSSSHLLLIAYSNMGEAGRVAARLRKAIDKTRRRLDRQRSRIRLGWFAWLVSSRSVAGNPIAQYDIRREGDQFRRVLANACQRCPRQSDSRSRRLRPSVQPSCCSPCWNTARRPRITGIVRDNP